MLGKYLWRAARLAGILAAFVAAGIAFMIWRRIPVQPTAGGKSVETLDVISLQIDILSITMAAIGIGLAVIALFGYQALKEAAEARAEKAASEVAAQKADEVATRAVAEHIEKLEARYQGLSAISGGDRHATASVDDVIPEGGKEAENGRDS